MSDPNSELAPESQPKESLEHLADQYRRFTNHLPGGKYRNSQTFELSEELKRMHQDIDFSIDDLISSGVRQELVTASIDSARETLALSKGRRDHIVIRTVIDQLRPIIDRLTALGYTLKTLSQTPPKSSHRP